MYTELTVTPGFVLERVLDLSVPKIHFNIFEITAKLGNIIRARFVYQLIFQNGRVNELSASVLRDFVQAEKDGKADSISQKCLAMHHHNIFKDFIDPGTATACIVPMAAEIEHKKKKTRKITDGTRLLAHDRKRTRKSRSAN